MPRASSEFSNILCKLKTSKDDKKVQPPKCKNEKLNGILVCHKQRKTKKFIPSSKTKRKVCFFYQINLKKTIETYLYLY